MRFHCTNNRKAPQQDCGKSLLTISSSKLTNGIEQNLHRFSIDLLPMNNQNVPNLSLVSFPLEVQDGLLTMVGDLFPNQDTIYMRFFLTYTCNHSCYTIYVRFFVTYTCVLILIIIVLSFTNRLSRTSLYLSLKTSFVYSNHRTEQFQF